MPCRVPQQPGFWKAPTTATRIRRPPGNRGVEEALHVTEHKQSACLHVQNDLSGSRYGEEWRVANLPGEFMFPAALRRYQATHRRLTECSASLGHLIGEILLPGLLQLRKHIGVISFARLLPVFLDVGKANLNGGAPPHGPPVSGTRRCSMASSLLPQVTQPRQTE